MPRFFPPIVYIEPRWHPDDSPSLRRARSFFRPNPTSINVWILRDNTVTKTQPWDPSQIKRELLGARNHIVSEFEAALLRGAGFVVDDDPIVVPVLGGYRSVYQRSYGAGSSSESDSDYFGSYPNTY